MVAWRRAPDAAASTPTAAVDSAHWRAVWPVERSAMVGSAPLARRAWQRSGRWNSADQVRSVPPAGGWWSTFAPAI